MECVWSIFGLNLNLSAVSADGNYTNTVVRDNIILGGFASDNPDSPTETKGENDEDAIIKSVTEESWPSLTC